jgi:endoglucanase
MKKNGLSSLFENLINSPSPSGFEEQIQIVYKEFTKKFVGDVKSDTHGNIIALKKGFGTKKVMLIAHSDEIGLIIKYIDDKGYIHFDAIGGIDYGLLPGLRVDILHNRSIVRGIIGKKPIHLLTDSEKKETPLAKDLWIDIGAKDKLEAQRIVNIGDYITFNSNIDYLPNDLVAIKAADNKIGVYIIAKVLEELANENLSASIYFVSSVQEEIGLRGAKTSTFSINPDVGIALDATHATDYPSIKLEEFGDIKLNNGVVIPVGANINKKVNELFFNAAKETKTNFQIEANACSTGTDAHAIEVSRNGVATGLLSIPCRYMHSPNEIVSIRDIKSTIKILSEFCRMINDDTCFIPY